MARTFRVGDLSIVWPVWRLSRPVNEIVEGTALLAAISTLDGGGFENDMTVFAGFLDTAVEAHTESSGF